MKTNNARYQVNFTEVEDFVARLDVGETLSACLDRLMKEKNLTPPQVYRRADLPRQSFDKYIQMKNPKRPSKQSLLQICIGILATKDQAVKLLATAGFCFEPLSTNDQAFMFCIGKGYYDMTSVWEVKAFLDYQTETEREIQS